MEGKLSRHKRMMFAKVRQQQLYNNIQISTSLCTLYVFTEKLWLGTVNLTVMVNIDGQLSRIRNHLGDQLLCISVW